jgi:hypothetical protein
VCSIQFKLGRVINYLDKSTLNFHFVDQYSGHFWERAVSLTAYAPVESGYFIQVSLLPDLNKMMLKDGDPLSAVIPIAENCPEYC